MNYKIFERCKINERLSEEQRADPIASEGRYFELSEEQIAPGESFNVMLKSQAAPQIARF